MKLFSRVMSHFSEDQKVYRAKEWRILAILVLWGAFLMGCSRTLDPLSEVDRSEYLLDLKAVPEGVLVDFSEAEDLKNKRGDSSFNIPYAWYIYRSKTSPYEDMQLLTRLYNPEAARTWEEVKDYYDSDKFDKYETLDYDLQAGWYRGAWNQPMDEEKIFLDQNVSVGQKYYYRVYGLGLSMRTKKDSSYWERTYSLHRQGSSSAWETIVWRP